MIKKFFLFLGRMFQKINPIGILLALYFLIFAWFTVFGEMGLMEYHSLYTTRQEFEERINHTQMEIEKTREIRENIKNPRNMESIIRQELGYVKSNEVVFKLDLD